MKIAYRKQNKLLVAKTLKSHLRPSDQTTIPTAWPTANFSATWTLQLSIFAFIFDAQTELHTNHCPFLGINVFPDYATNQCTGELTASINASQYNCFSRQSRLLYYYYMWCVYIWLHYLLANKLTEIPFIANAFRLPLQCGLMIR